MWPHLFLIGDIAESIYYVNANVLVGMITASSKHVQGDPRLSIIHELINLVSSKSDRNGAKIVNFCFETWERLLEIRLD